MRIRACAAEIVEHGRDISEAFEGAQEHARRAGSFLLNDATNPDTPAGTATIAVEIIQALKGFGQASERNARASNFHVEPAV